MHTINVVITAAMPSATGPAYIIPSIPIKNGNTTSNGSKKRICLVKARKLPLFGFPIAVKKFDVIGCIKFAKVKNI